MPKNLSARYYKKKQRKALKRKLEKGIKVFLKNKTTRSNNIVANDKK